MYLVAKFIFQYLFTNVNTANFLTIENNFDTLNHLCILAIANSIGSNQNIVGFMPKRINKGL